MIYEYRCQKCGTLVEIRASLAEKERGLHPECPRCGGTRFQQVFTAVNVITRPGGGSLPPLCGPGTGAGCC